MSEITENKLAATVAPTDIHLELPECEGLFQHIYQLNECMY